jgi:hypothetical protein
LADVAPLLERLPVLATNLAGAPQRELRALFESLALEVAYQPAEEAIDIGLTLYDDERSLPALCEVSEDWSVPPAGFEPATRRLEGGRSVH